MADLPPELGRYHRQMLLPGIGEAGQRRLVAAHVLVVGCGALGTVIADGLARAGVGRLRLVDRDVVEITNLQRQILFDESDVRRCLPKAEAARERLGQINSQVRVEACVDDFNHRSAERLARDVHLVMDGLDNFETRYLLNDLAVSHHLPYVYGGAVGVTGMSMPILPAANGLPPDAPGAIRWSPDQATPCLRCIFPEAPPPGSIPTCDTAGVLGAVVMIIAAHQVAQAIKLITGHIDRLDRSLLSIDLWANQTARYDVQGALSEACPCCARRRFSFLRGETTTAASMLCGRNAVQVAGGAEEIDLQSLALRLEPHGSFRHNGFLLHGTFDRERGIGGEPIALTLFPNGRAIVAGTNEPEAARTIYARYVGG
jgi:adenylyltransferase/sulfurtransferase